MTISFQTCFRKVPSLTRTRLWLKSQTSAHHPGFLAGLDLRVAATVSPRVVGLLLTLRSHLTHHLVRAPWAMAPRLRPHCCAVVHRPPVNAPRLSVPRLYYSSDTSTEYMARPSSGYGMQLSWVSRSLKVETESLRAQSKHRSHRGIIFPFCRNILNSSSPADKQGATIFDTRTISTIY